MFPLHHDTVLISDILAQALKVCAFLYAKESTFAGCASCVQLTTTKTMT